MRVHSWALSFLIYKEILFGIITKPAIYLSMYGTKYVGFKNGPMKKERWET